MRRKTISKSPCRAPLLLLLLMLLLAAQLCHFPATVVGASDTTSTRSSTSKKKAYQICSLSGGLDVTRLVSISTRSLFRSALEDVEFIREYLSEAALNNGIVGGLSDLDDMATTLDWQARGKTFGDTTITAGLGYCDDRHDRRLDRFVSLSENSQPSVGNKSTDMALIDTASNILPWIVDRRSVPNKWWLNHTNGHSHLVVVEKKNNAKHNNETTTTGLPTTTTQEESGDYNHFQELYTAAWIGTKGEAYLYYPPLRVYGHPLGFGDVLGAQYESQDTPFIKPNLPANNPERTAQFSKPYPDNAVPGLSLITAMAPVYLSGSFRGYQYQDTYVASAGVDIAVSAVSSQLDVLQDSLTPGSFGILVDADFNAVVISQEVVNRIYPRYTGQEDERVTYDPKGNFVEDRRNVPYLPADTILQDLTRLTSANWTHLLHIVRAVPAGARGLAQLNITLTGQTEPIEFHVMFEKWSNVATWTMLVFAPVFELENAVNVAITTDQKRKRWKRDEVRNGAVIKLEGVKNDILTGKAFVVNNGNLDVLVSANLLPKWVQLSNTTLLMQYESGVFLPSGESLEVEFHVLTADLSAGNHDSAVALSVRDAEYPDCVYHADFILQLQVLVLGTKCDSALFEGPMGNCVTYTTVIVATVVPLIFLPLLVLYLRELHKRNKSYTSWQIDKNELIFDESPQLIGAGAFGSVYLANFRGTQVAVKKPHNFRGKDKAKGDLDLEASVSQAGKRSLIKDLHFLTSLRHPAIVTIMGAVVESGKDPLVVFEYMEQGSLFDLLRNNTVELDGELVQGFLRDMTQGLQFLHSATPQVVHKYFKSPNVLIDSKFRAKVSDFGLDHWAVGGTPAWTAPEVIRGASECTPASDVYSLGIVLYEIYARDLPPAKEGVGWETAVGSVGVFRDMNSNPDIPKSMPTVIAALFQDCLRADPEERPSIDEIAKRVRRFDASEVEPRGLIKRPKPGEQNFDLLLRVFPRHIAEALRDGRTVEPESHECVTCVFTDIVNFTVLSCELTPQKVADMLHRLFLKFDLLGGEHHVFKVETIGDAWMGVTNCVEDQSTDHTLRIAKFGVAAIEAAGRTLIDVDDLGRGFVEIRVGFHSGSVLSNVIGSHNPRYALFGDTVNTASRMESNSTAGRILCSERSALLLQQQDLKGEIGVAFRGLVPIKGKGDMNVYWVTQRQRAGGNNNTDDNDWEG